MVRIGKAIGWTAILIVLVVVVVEIYMLGTGVSPMDVLRKLWLPYLVAQLLVMIAGLVARIEKGDQYAQ